MKRTSLRCDSGAITVEFVIVMTVFMVIVFFVIEVALAQFYWQTAEKAVQVGVRLAIVSDLAVPTYTCGNATSGAIPATNCLCAGGSSGCVATPLNGGACDATPSNCASFTAVSCTGAGCSATPFNYILARMQQMYPPIQAANVTITYAYSGLGFAGGPNIPTVTITMSGVPLHLGFVAGIPPLANIPTMSVTMTGEDLHSSSTSP